jgi:hypothetical protein
VGRVTLKRNDDEVLRDESLQKSNGNEALSNDPLEKVMPMKRVKCSKIKS